MKPAAFFFDLDGTLIDSEQLWTQAIIDWLADRSVAVTLEDFAPRVCGRSWLDIHAALHRDHPQLPRASALEDAKTLRPYYHRLCADPARLIIPGAVAFFRKAARVAPCAIVSGSPHEDVEEAARLCGIAHLLAFVLGGEDYGRGKPAPDGYLAAAARLDVDASECVVVEDSTSGVASGRAAGMRVIGVDRNRLCPQNLTGCDWLVRDLSELDPDALLEN
jgi:beta-phosphoglucomutase-like phosphatase (HAD superfamily)